MKAGPGSAAYLLKGIATGDGAGGFNSNLVSYYAKSGNPPGFFLGSGLRHLSNGRGVAEGAEVDYQHLMRMAVDCADPLTGEILGRRPGKDAVAGFDLTFSPQKSVSVAWAMADRGLQAVIHEEHHAAVRETLAALERMGINSRSGADGIVYEEADGIVAAAFDHFANRDDDPQLHTHVCVLNRVRSRSDGRWRTIDSRTLHRTANTASALYNGLLMDRLTARLGVDWVSELTTSGLSSSWEIDGVDRDLRRLFSSRAEAIETTTEGYRAEFRSRFGREPRATEAIAMRQRAWRDTRGRKHNHSMAELAAMWRDKAAPYVGDNATEWVVRLTGRSQVPPTRAEDWIGSEVAEQVAQRALAVVAEKRSVFTRHNIASEVNRQLAPFRFVITESTDGGMSHRETVVEHITDLASRHVVPVTPPSPFHVPRAFQCEDGASRLMPTQIAEFTTLDILETEQRLLAFSNDRSAARLDPGMPWYTEVLTAPISEDDPDVRLDETSKTAVTTVLASGRRIEPLVGPAGSGKTTTMRVVRRLWEVEHGATSVIGMAPSAAASRVLGEELRVPANNTAKFRTEIALRARREANLAELLTRNVTRAEAKARLDKAQAALRLIEANPDARNTGYHHEVRDDLFQARALLSSRPRAERIADLRNALDTWRVKPNQLVIVDEAGMVGTHALDDLAREVANVPGAKLLLVGDPHQLASVETGGAFAMLANRLPDHAELTSLYRFKHGWEKRATLDLRHGNMKVIDTYLAPHWLRDEDTDELVKSGDRIVLGAADDLTERAYASWKTDRDRGRQALMIAQSNAQVTTLNARAQADLRAAGKVAEPSTDIAAGERAGTGDTIVTRQNNSAILTGTRRVENGDRWIVTATHADGSLDAARVGSHGAPNLAKRVTLPASYAREHVRLGYAATAHSAQGQTVDCAYTLVDASMTREALYVAMTRGRWMNRMFVDIYDEGDGHSHGPSEVQARLGRPPVPPKDPSDKAARRYEHQLAEWNAKIEAEGRRVLAAVLDNVGADRSATEQINDGFRSMTSIQRLATEFDTYAKAAQADRWITILSRSELSATEVEEVTESDAFGPLTALLRRAEARGHTGQAIVDQLVEQAPLDDARDIAAVLHGRLEATGLATKGHPPNRDRSVVGLLAYPRGVTDPDFKQALDEHAKAIEEAAQVKVEEAIERRDPWVRALGTVPTGPVEREEWMSHARTVAAGWELGTFVDEDLAALRSAMRDDDSARMRGYASEMLKAAQEAKRISDAARTATNGTSMSTAPTAEGPDL